jgi:hypothetical protein
MHACLALAVLAFAPSSRAGETPPCDASFLVQGEPLLGAAPEVVDVDQDGVSIRGFCDKKRARVRAVPEGARLRVRFTSVCPAGRLCPTTSFVGAVRLFYGPRQISRCEGMRGVRLEAVVDPSCQTLAGRLRARRPRIDREFVATASSLPPPECVPNVEGESCLCGTMFLLACPEATFCDPDPGLCFYSDIGGACMPVPAECPEVSEPVCGCDGVTYENDCARRAATVPKDHDGACAVAQSE